MTEREEVKKLEQALALIREVQAARIDDRGLETAAKPSEARVRFLLVLPQNSEDGK